MNTETSTQNSALGIETKKPQSFSAESSTNLFNVHGRLIPGPQDTVFSQESRGYFALLQPKLDYTQIYANLRTYLQIESVSEREFTDTALSLLEKIEASPQMKDLLKGVHIPFVLPKATADTDLGQELDSVLLPAVGKAYQERFPDFLFTNYCNGNLKGQVKLVHGTRYEELLERRKSGPVIGWYFANCLAEYSIRSQRSLIERLPKEFVLSGPLEAAAAIVGSPDLLMRQDKIYPPLLSLTSVTPLEEPFFYFFEAYGWDLTFNRRSYTGAVSEFFAGGLSIF